MLLFLDIDGVMLPAISWKRYENLEDNFPAFTAEAVEALNILLSAEKTYVILTTSHRDRFTLEEWKEIFKRRGVEIYKISKLESSKFKRRIDEIRNYFDTYDFDENFLIIDDDTSLHDLSEEMKKYTIITSPLIGLKKDLICNIQYK